MCCFSRPVKSVTDTNIFARDSGAVMQVLVYQMKFAADEDLAMILPIPVRQPSLEKHVRFFNLEKYPNFFDNMESGFPQPKSEGTFGGGSTPRRRKLKVIDVGVFEASFVPTVGEFSALDERFRLPTNTWEKLPTYKTYGFVVFKLKKDHGKAHPMAFEFPRADPSKLYFPTVHIHDGEIHDKAEFDHTLYAQFNTGHRINATNWMESIQPAGMFMNLTKCAALVDKNAHVYKRSVMGMQKNEDIVA